ncbi:cofilin-1-like [Sciurus carolinensis]|uniref:cofilin-1-like n=1 Tax=Sciurus carolinensis TaxID=30640 RepID=UPI001FB1E51B|nr:cofilin-1-like [Sciurus carolinensis]
MTSGCSDGIGKVFRDMKEHTSSAPEGGRKCKEEVLCPSEDKNAPSRGGQGVLVVVWAGLDDLPTTFVRMLPDKDCLSASVMQRRRPRRVRRSTCVYLLAPESTPLKSKTICTSSKDAIKWKLTGIRQDL